MGAFALFKCIPHGGHIAQICHHFRHSGDDVVYLLHGVVLADGKSQRAVGNLVGQTQTQKHMAGIQRTGGAGGAGAGADALGIQPQKKAFALDALKAHIDSAGDMVLKAAVDSAVGDL